MKYKYVIQNRETKKLRLWSIRQVVNEINRDRSDEWTPYTTSDWKQGWKEFVEADNYCPFTMIGKIRTK
jgi:hypothetical protein